MDDLKSKKTAAKDIPCITEKTELSSVKTILEIDECMSWYVDDKKKNRFAFFVKSPVNQTFTVDWGDGAVCRHNGSERRILLFHNYLYAKKYVVTIQGVITTLVDYNAKFEEIRENPFYIETCDLRSNPYIEALDCGAELLLHNNYSLKELDRLAACRRHHPFGRCVVCG